MSRTGPEITEAQEQRRRRRSRQRRRTEQDALHTLAVAVGSQWFHVLGMWATMCAVGVLARLWISSDTWGEALAYGALYASFFTLIWGPMERRRRRHLRHVSGTRSLERGTVTARRGRWVQVQGEQHEVTWRTETPVGLSVGDEVYAAPAIAPGQRIVLVRESNTRGLLRDVMGPRSESVAAGPTSSR